MTALLTDLAGWELFSSNLAPDAAGLDSIQRKIANLKLIIERLERVEEENV